MVYNFKSIMTVPKSMEFVDFILSKTQRKTPTVVHKQFQISRIRRFYMRKVKFTQQNFHDRFEIILTQFPHIADIHPFYSELLNTLYNKDHYKLSLGQISTAKHLVDRVSSDYVRLLKYGDSLYRCKQLKRAALGRMVTIVKKQSSTLTYLEEVRQHMSRLPSIDPYSRTLLLCGCPNAGKSSFINLITNANVDVQPYAFTTKSLFVGHTDYEYLKWQVIDTPGILDRPVDEMNTIELQALTALAHLKAAVIFFLDISEQCDIFIEQQLRIFEKIRPFFTDKPLILACNKADIVSLKELGEKYPEKRAMIQVIEDEGVTVLETSSLSKEGVAEVKRQACDKLLIQRVDMKLRSRKADSILNRIHVAMPVARDQKIREPFIPGAALILRKRKRDAEKMDGEEMDVEKTDVEKISKKNEKQLEDELMEDYILDLNKTKLLANDEEKYDKYPIYYNGKHVQDFIQPDLAEKLKVLQEEEEKRIAAGIYDIEPEPLTAEEAAIIKLARRFRNIIKVKNMKRMAEGSGRPQIPRSKQRRDVSTTSLRSDFTDLGFDMTQTQNSNFTETGRSRARGPKRLKVAEKEPVRSRSASRTPRDRSGIRDPEMLIKVKKLEVRAKSTISFQGRKSEGDRHYYDAKPKHLNTGKRGIGKTDRR